MKAKKKDNFDNYITVAAVGLGAYLLIFGGKGEEGTGSEGGSFVMPVIPGETVQPISSGGTTKKEAFTGLDFGLSNFLQTSPNTYSGIRTLTGGSQKAIEGSIDIMGNQLNPITGQLYSDVGNGQRLYSEKSKDIPLSKKEITIGAQRTDPNHPVNLQKPPALYGTISPSGQVYSSLQKKMGVVLK